MNNSMTDGTDLHFQDSGVRATLSAHTMLVDSEVARADRLAALSRTRLLDTPAEDAYNRIANLAAKILAAPIATVTLIDRDRQFYKACIGLPEPLSDIRETPLEYSFCRHTIAVGEPLVIADTLLDERVAGMPSVTEYGVRAYAGIPLLVDREAIGTLCVMDLEPRSWTADQIGMLTDLASMAMTEINLRIVIRELEAAATTTDEARKEAERANKSKSDFVAMMSHDLRTPLNAIGGYRQLLELGIPGPVNEAQLKTLSRIKLAQDRLSYLISEVLDFSRLEAGTLSHDPSHVSVDAILGQLETFIRPQLDQKRITYNYEGGDRSVKVFADTDKVVQVLTNLLTNAIKFTPEGGSISLGWRSDDNWILISVGDTGIGIPPDRIESIFEPFVQVPGQRTMNPTGVGLGLAIGRKLALLMNGDLTVESREGVGTVFTLKLPQRE